MKPSNVRTTGLAGWSRSPALEPLLIGYLIGKDGEIREHLPLAEAPEHPHALARNAFRNIEGVIQPAPAPRFSRTEADLDRPEIPQA